MIRNVLTISLLTIFCTLLSNAQQVTISGNDPDYAGREIVFYSIDNYFSNGKIRMGKCTVSGDGSFTASFPCQNARFVYTGLGIFHVRFFVEPGFSYEVKLPPRIDKTQEEEESPFFRETMANMVILAVKDDKGQTVPPENELNFRSMRFDSFFNPLYDQLAVDAAKDCPGTWLDSCINIFQETLPRTGNGYFDNYAFYSSGLLYFAAQREGARYVSDNYFAGKPALYDNNAYMELFNATYREYFMYFGRLDNSIYNVINRQGSFIRLKRLLAQDGVLSTDSLCELVILKNIHDEFYTERFSRGALLNMLDSAVVHSKIERHREIAAEIRSKTTKLLRGFEPPDFSLYSQDSVLVSLQNYRGKYVYLMFCTTQNYSCLTQYNILEKIYKTHHKWLDIVVVSADDKLSNMQYFKQKSGYQWDFLHFANEPDVFEKYDVRIFPTGFLIDPAGKLVLSPAPVPAPIYDPESFEDSPLEQALWQELQGKRLLQEYIRSGLINQ